MTPTYSNPTIGLLWMVLATLCYSGMIGAVRVLGTELPTVQSAFIRFAIGCVLLAPFFPALIQRGFPPGTPRLFLVRGVIHTLGTVLWFFALVRLPVAEVTAIGYLTPIIMTAGAAIMFSEKLTSARVLSVVVAIIGALIVLRPGLRVLETGHLAQIASAALFGLSFLWAKKLAHMAGPTLVIVMMSVSITVLLAPAALWTWQSVSTHQFLWLAISALFATAANYCHTKSYEMAPLVVTQPVGFLQLVWATLMGIFLFDEDMDIWVICGGGLIVLAAVLSSLREAWGRRAETTPKR